LLLLVGAGPAEPNHTPVRAALPKSDPLHLLIEVKGMERYKKILLENEPRQLWKQIHWSTVDEVQKLAKENRKPILIAMMTGAGGKAKAPFT
jgi:hypothetical protein